MAVLTLLLMLRFTGLQVLPQDVDSQYGIAHSPIGPSPSQSPLAFRPFGTAPSAPPSVYSSALARTASASNNTSLHAAGLARTTSASGGGIASRLSQVTSSNEATAATAAGSEEEQQQAAGDAALASLQEEGNLEQSAPSTASEVDSLPGVTQSVDPSGKVTDSQAEAPIAGTSSNWESQPQNASPDEAAGSNDLQSRIDELSILTEPAGAAAADSAAAQAAGEAAAPAPSEAELQQSLDAMLSGEDQAMKESLAAANAAGGERVADALASSSSGLQQPPAVNPSPSAPSSAPSYTATAAAAEDESGVGSESATEAKAERPPDTEQQSDADAEPALNAPARQSSISSQVAERFRSGFLSQHVYLLFLEGCYMCMHDAAALAMGSKMLGGTASGAVIQAKHAKALSRQTTGTTLCSAASFFSKGSLAPPMTDDQVD